MSEDNKQHDESFDWGALLRRKDRPLPKKGCSIAFYSVLLVLLVYLTIS